MKMIGGHTAGSYSNSESKKLIFDERSYNIILDWRLEHFYDQLDTMPGDWMLELDWRIPQTISNLKVDEEWNRRGAREGLEGASIKKAEELKSKWELLELKLNAVRARGSRCSWSNCKSEWRHLLGGKRRSKSSNKPKKSAKRVKTAKRSKSRKIRRQRK